MQEIAASYSARKPRRLSKKRALMEKRCAAMRAEKARRRLDSDEPIRETQPELPALRRILVVIDMDSGRPRARMMQFWVGDRRDRFRIRTPRGESAHPIGWSRALAVVRKAMPR